MLHIYAYIFSVSYDISDLVLKNNKVSEHQTNTDASCQLKSVI